jgi:hypothetical protein
MIRMVQGKKFLPLVLISLLLFCGGGHAQSVVKDNVLCLYGFKDEKGKWLIEPKFTYATPFIHGFSIVSNGEHYGVVNAKGKTVVPLVYDKLEFFRLGLTWIPHWEMDAPYEETDAQPGIFRCFTENGAGVIDTAGRVLIEPVYEEIWDFTNGLACISYMGRYGLVDERGRIILPAEFTFCPDYGYSNIFIIRKGDKVGVADRSGVLLPAVYDDVRLKDSLSVIALMNSGWGVIDASGKEVLPFAFDKLEYFGPDKVIYKKQNKWGIASRITGSQSQIQYDSIGLLSGKAAAIASKGKYGMIDANGNELEPPIYDTLLGGAYAVLVRGNKVVCYNLRGEPRREFPSAPNGKVMIIGENRNKFSSGLCDTLGNLLLELKYEIDYPGDGLFFCIDEKGGTIAYDANGKRLEKFSHYSSVSEYIGGYAYMVTKNGKAGVCDRSGDPLFPAKFYGVSYYDASLGLAWVLPQRPPLNEGAVDSNDINWCAARYALVDRRGRPVVREVFERPSDFVFDQTVTRKNGYEGVLDARGKTIIPFSYDEIIPLQNGIYKVRKDTAWGLADSKGKIFVEPLYPLMFDLNNGYMRVQGATHEGLLDALGNQIIPYGIHTWAFSPVNLDSLHFPELYKEENYFYEPSRAIGNVQIIYLFRHENKKLERITLNFILSEAYDLSLDDSDEEYAEYFGECMFRLFMKGSSSRTNLLPNGYYSISHELAVTGITDSTFSFVHIRTETDRYSSYRDFSYSTYSVAGRKLEAITLDSLFDGSQDYRHVLNTLLLEEARYLEMDCPNPEEFIYGLEKNFAITDEGLLFFMPGTGEAVKLGYGSVKGIIKKDGPLSRYL